MGSKPRREESLRKPRGRNKNGQNNVDHGMREVCTCRSCCWYDRPPTLYCSTSFVEACGLGCAAVSPCRQSHSCSSPYHTWSLPACPHSGKLMQTTLTVAERRATLMLRLQSWWRRLEALARGAEAGEHIRGGQGWHDGLR